MYFINFLFNLSLSYFFFSSFVSCYYIHKINLMVPLKASVFIFFNFFLFLLSSSYLFLLICVTSLYPHLMVPVRASDTIRADHFTHLHFINISFFFPRCSSYLAPRLCLLINALTHYLIRKLTWVFPLPVALIRCALMEGFICISFLFPFTFFFPA